MNPMVVDRLSVITDEERAILNGRKSIDRYIYMDGSRDVISGEKLLEKGKLIAIRPHTRFIAFPEHTHDYVEMVYMCRGETRHTVNGNAIILRQGELLMLGQNAHQSIEAAGEQDIAVNFIVRPAFFSGTLPFLGEEETPLRRFVVSCLTGENEAGYLLFHVAELLPVQNLIENLLYTLLEDTPNKRGILQMTMGLLFAQLMNHTEALQFETQEQNAVISVLRYLEENYRDGSLTEIAGRLHYELPSLSRLIRQKTGKNYTELLQEKRLSQAAWLVRNTDKNVDEIANAVGYENLSYFHRLFAARYGLSPKKYRDCK
ncbi:MAG: helix-turn-helix domain-containing protein [Oscillospiraceae bacterium]|nr:helix-turn-helix domain-containing protein [Clostridia bacterium]MBQ6317554.1 helix-turn-helix domain-containing protein [Oscillospiraceae bacterium]